MLRVIHSGVELSSGFGRFDYPNEVGPGVYDTRRATWCRRRRPCRPRLTEPAAGAAQRGAPRWGATGWTCRASGPGPAGFAPAKSVSSATVVILPAGA